MIRGGELHIHPKLHFIFGSKPIQVPILGMIYHMESGTLKVLWVTCQIIQSINFNLSVQFPPPYATLMYYFSFFELDFLSIECYKSGYILSVYLASLFPVLLAILCWLLFLFRRFRLFTKSTRYRKQNEAQKLYSGHMRAFLLIIYIFVPPVSLHTRIYTSIKKYILTAVFIFFLFSFNKFYIYIFPHFFFYKEKTLCMCLLFSLSHPHSLPLSLTDTQVANKQFRALDCQVLKDGQSFLRADTSVDCQSKSYQNFVKIDIILIFIYQCLPLFYVLLLWRVRDKLNPKAANKELALELRDSDESLEAIRVKQN